MLNLFSVKNPSHLIMKKMKQMLSLFLMSGSNYLTFKCWPKEGEFAEPGSRNLLCVS